MALSFGAAGAQSASSPHDLKVAFVGKPMTARGATLEAFLKERFAEVAVFDRADVKPDELQPFDVVVLDWPQHEGVMKWMNNRVG